MINLLAPDDRRQLAAARTNSLLLRYVILLGIFIVVLVAELGGAYLMLTTTKATDQATIDSNAQGTLSFAQTKNDLANFNADLATAKYILGQQVPYTTIILRLAAALPADATLDRVTIDPTTFGTSTLLTVHTVSYPKAIEVKSSLQASGIFSDVSFQSISEHSDGKYPYTASYNVTYSKGLLK